MDGILRSNKNRIGLLLFSFLIVAVSEKTARLKGESVYCCDVISRWLTLVEMSACIVDRLLLASAKHETSVMYELNSTANR